MRSDARGSSTERLLDIPDADAAEQSRDLRPAPAGEGPAAEASPGTGGGVAAEADEFDAVEQRLVVEQDDEEEYR